MHSLRKENLNIKEGDIVLDTNEIFRRNSIRAYLSKEIPPEVLNRVLNTALISPSWANTQPCRVHVLTGDKKSRVSERMIYAAQDRTPKKPDLPIPSNWPEEMTERSRKHAIDRSKYANIERHEKQKRFEFQLTMYRFFDAPVGLIFTIDNSLENWSLLDVGFAMQNIMLAANIEGLGTCPQASAVYYPGILREELGLDDQTKIIAGMAIGYPDQDASLNQYKADRRPVEDVVYWY
jgi:nitroreductase